MTPRTATPVAWDLYGGVGAFVPAMMSSLGDSARIHSVDQSRQSTAVGRATFGDHASFHAGAVEAVVSKLPAPDVVVLDPPRVGAGDRVISAISEAAPQLVIHIGCDPATFSRDMKKWYESGYQLCHLSLFNAFPGTHHFETIGVLER